MHQLKIISYKQLENASSRHDRKSAMLMNNNNLQGILRKHLNNIIDKELANKIILGYVKHSDNIAVTNDISTVLDVLLNTAIRLKHPVIDVYDLAVCGSGVTSMIYIYIYDDIVPISLFVARSNRNEYVYSPVLLKSADRIHDILKDESCFNK